MNRVPTKTEISSFSFLIVDKNIVKDKDYFISGMDFKNEYRDFY